MTTTVLILPSNPNSFDVKVETFDNDVLTNTHIISGPEHYQTYVTDSRHLVISEKQKVKS